MSKKKNKLTPKQLNFVCEYLKTGNASAAYRSSYSADKMSNAAVGEEAYRLLQNPEISLIVENAKQKAVEKAELSQEWVVQKLVQTVELCLATQTDEDGVVTTSAAFNPSASNKALELLGKELGMFSDKNKDADRTNSAEFNARILELAFRLRETGSTLVNGAGKVVEGEIQLPGLRKIN